MNARLCGRGGGILLVAMSAFSASWALSESAKLLASDGAAIGWDVDVSGNTFVAGYPVGYAVYVFVQSGGTWTQQARLTVPPDSGVGGEFGRAVALVGNTLLIGRPTSGDFCGFTFFDCGRSAHVYVRSGTSWSYQARLVDAGFPDQFGGAVALSQDGNTALVGAESASGGAGAAYVFAWNGTSWSQQAVLAAADPRTNDRFGKAVALSEDGNTAVIGATGCDCGTGSDDTRGSAYVFVRSGTSWSQQTKLTVSDGAQLDYMGWGVAVSGDTALVGAKGRDHGAVNAGVTYVFVRSGESWGLQALLGPSAPQSFAAFGTSVALSGNQAVIGSPEYQSNQGAAWVFNRGGVSWTQQHQLVASSPSNANLGHSVGLSGGRVVLGGSTHNAVYVYDFDGDGDGASPPQDCDDTNPDVRPGATELCNGRDDDCDGLVNEGFVLGATCSAGLGACQSSGVTVCTGDGAGTVCNAVSGMPAVNDALCNAVDDDCNGATDEDFVSETTSCGVGACAASGTTSCVAGAVQDSCTPGAPAADDSLCNAVDDDCNGATDEDFVSETTSCGVGACSASGETQCQAGQVTDTCTSLPPGGEVCDDLDNDCDGTVDDAATLLVQVDRHTVGPGSHPGSTKTPLTGLGIGVYDRSEGSCARVTCGGTAWQHYACITSTCTAVAHAMTDGGGQAEFALPAGDYLIIGSDGTDKHLGALAPDLACGGQMRKFLQQLVTANGKVHPGKTSVRTGSELLVVEPEYVEWTGTEELYPFVFESLGNWSVTTSVSPPEGFVANHDSLTADVTTEIEPVQFTITDVGSDWVPTEVRHVVRHGARYEVIRSRIGVRLSKELARAKGLDRAGRPVDADGMTMHASEADPRAEKTAEIAGWIEPSTAGRDWEVKVRVNRGASLRVTLTDARGRVVRSLGAGHFAPGEHALTWDGRDAEGRMLEPGEYQLAVQAGTATDSVRVSP